MTSNRETPDQIGRVGISATVCQVFFQMLQFEVHVLSFSCFLKPAILPFLLFLLQTIV